MKSCDAVAERNDGADLGHLNGALIVLDLIANQLCDFAGADLSHGLVRSSGSSLSGERTVEPAQLGAQRAVVERRANAHQRAAEVHAVSADHLEMANPAGREALARNGVIATILPGCTLFLGKGPWPDGRALRDAGCEVAVATDCNPGSSMVADLPLCATMSATLCGLTLEEALWAITRGGAKALGLDDRGRLTKGERADFVVVDHKDWRALLYRPADAPVHSVYIDGECVVPTA